MSRRLAVAAALLVLATGCVMPARSAVLLEHADRLVEQGDYADAVKVYDEVLAKYPGDRLASRALASRQALVSLLAARADVVRLRQELSVRDAELARLRHDLEKLREDLENLKQIDLRERRR